MSVKKQTAESEGCSSQTLYLDMTCLWHVALIIPEPTHPTHPFLWCPSPCRHQYSLAEDLEAAESIAVLTGNVLLFQLINSTRTASLMRSQRLCCSLGAVQPCYCGPYKIGARECGHCVREDALLKYIIIHQRDPMPFLEICIDNGASHQAALQGLLKAGKWGTAHLFVASVPSTHPFSHFGWESLGLAYIAAGRQLSTDQAFKSHWLDDGPGPVWELVISCARRSCITRVGAHNVNSLWSQIFSFCYTKGGCEAALDIAEEAAHRTASQAGLADLVAEHLAARNEAKARRCEDYAINLLCPGRFDAFRCVCGICKSFRSQPLCLRKQHADKYPCLEKVVLGNH